MSERFFVNIALPDPPLEWVCPTMLDGVAGRILEVRDRNAIAKRVRDGFGAKGINDPGWVEDEPEPSPTQNVRCACGRKEWIGVMEDVRNLAPEIRERVCRFKGGTPPDYLCSGCREILVREGLTDYYALAEAQGAPADWLAWLEIKLRRRPDAKGVPDFIKATMQGLEVPDAVAPL